MSRLTRPVAGGLATVVAAGMLAAWQPTAGASPGTSAATAAPVGATNAAAASSSRTGSTSADATHTVTLITGDVVTVTDRGAGPGTATVQPAKGSDGGVQIQMIGRDLHVVPDEALPYLASGRLDEDLFNVTELISQGYDDAGTDVLPLIVQYKPSLRSIPAEPAYADRTRALPSINGSALEANKDRARKFWLSITSDVPAGATARFDAGLGKVHLDERVRASLADSVAQVGAPEAWAAGFDGTGVKVAVLDTGIDATHPDLADQIVQTQSFVPGEDIVDIDGHGTHVASTVAGTGAASGGQEKGVAPGADLVIGKVLDNSGFGASSWIIDGMEWASQHAKVVNMSLGSQEASDGTDPMAVAVDELSAATGTLFVIASGNNGRIGGVSSPAAADAALTVGAVDSGDQLAWFSNQGPGLGDALVKPEIVAPGVDILAARSSASPGQGDYTSMSGTSMATPHVAGAAAILAQQHPGWTGDQIKQALVSTSKPLDGRTAYEVGAGRLDIPSTLLGSIVATGSTSFGFFDYPHDGDAPVDRTVTYTNLGAADVTLDLTTSVTDASLSPAPAGMVTLSAAQVTVPANGTADVTVTADPNAGVAGATYSGTVIASAAGEQVAQTAVGLVKEEERYSLDISAIDREGQAAGGYVTLYRYGDQWVNTLPIDPATGTVATQRLRPGIYNVTSWLPVSGELGGDSSGVALVGNPHLVVDQNREIVLDARDANRITVRTPKVSEDIYRRTGYFHDSGIDDPFRTFVNQYTVPANVDEMYAAPTGQVAGAGYEYLTRWRRTAPLLSLSAITRGQQLLTPLYQLGSTRYEGTDRLAAVYAGNGTPDSYAGIDAVGKVVLVSRDDTVDPMTRAQAAVDAGAAALVVVNTERGRYYEWAGGTDLPVISLTAAEGQPLVDRLVDGRRVSFRIHGTEFPPYLYDLVDAHQGGIPANLRYAPAQRELATITNRFVGAERELAFESRADCRAWYWPPCLEVYEPVQTGSTRTDYVSTQEGTEWYEGAVHSAGWELRGDRVAYSARQHETNTWFDPIVRPRLGTGFWPARRSGDFFAVNVPQASSGDEGVTGSMLDSSTIVSRLYQEGELIRESPFQAVQTTVPQTAGWAEYRFEQDTTRPGDVWTHSVSSSTAWTFRAETTPSNDWVDLPLLQLDYHVATDLRGAVRAGSKQTIGVTAFHFVATQGAGKVRGTTLHLSYDDGDTWRPVRLERAGQGTWEGKVTIPKRGADFVSIRATGWDGAGNEVEQTVMRAFSVR
jgi:subtilisin family serine protease